jgi:hypothetical protein
MGSARLQFSLCLPQGGVDGGLEVSLTHDTVA